MRPLALLIVLLVLCAPASIALGAPPPSLRGASPTITTGLSPTVTWPLGTARPAASSTAAVAGDLPYTGENLAPEALGAILLLAAGVGIRLRLRWR